MDNVRYPAQFLHSLQHASCKKDGALSIISIVGSVLIFVHLTPAEIVVVVDEIDLHFA